MKTALTQLIDKWESELGSYIPNAPIYKAFIAEAKELLEAEKEQIINSFNDGVMEESESSFHNEKRISGKEYYNQTFKSDE